MKDIYLTIDDGPSATTVQKVEWLAERRVPAMLFCIGSHLVTHMDSAVDAIRRGFWIGNHAYSHRRFSTLDLDVWRDELRATEALITAAYAQAGTERRHKLFRFPFGDKGGPRHADIQALLRDEGFAQPSFRGVAYGQYIARGYDRDADCSWTVESYEYRIQPAADNLALLRAPHPRTGGSVEDPSSADILLIHDHAATTDVFFAILDGLLTMDLRFVLPQLS